jgi:hypothetical protein
MVLKKRDKILGLIAISVVILFMGERFFAGGLRGRFRNLSSRVRVQELELKNGLALLEKKEDINRDFERCQPYLKIKYLTDKEVIAGFLKEMERIAQETGVSVVSLVPQQQGIQAAGYRRFSASMQVEAEPSRMYDFLFKIQNSTFLIKADSVSISAKGLGAAKMKIELALSMAVPVNNAAEK